MGKVLHVLVCVVVIGQGMEMFGRGSGFGGISQGLPPPLI